MSQDLLPVVILISGTGTNLQALIDAARSGAIPVRIAAVVSNRPEAPGLERAREAGITTHVVDHTRYPDREHFDQALQACIDAYRPGLVVLAGFMRILTPGFVEHFAGRLINIHPSLLPDFRGLKTHERALRAGVQEHGASVHFVNNELDGGPVIMQARVPVHPGDTPAELAARVQTREHELYPAVVGLFGTGRLRLEQDRVLLDGRPVDTPLDLDASRKDRKEN
ncbi:phosphoribosylglycinamide formyltransferase [Thioalkalivibrio denitrificans]|uniref:Phosphoribosylglycinamide formyltransferase n=1 Tax=Thioalkalivibrio denitrificans TaxID=108003 RepID=A0A1V3NLS5_9GAMM|nr:phosphoribosylglycinamide formyltransferase [Thioalkalivibrio denitrificans]OOG25903.1 phosphoribosylglycinamide formyltransferase [Thioalkalivibrio denitrificans]